LFKSVASKISQFVNVVAAITAQVIKTDVRITEKVSFPTFSKNLFLSIIYIYYRYLKSISFFSLSQNMKDLLTIYYLFQ
jgi:hypothetical protein